ncbi:MAG: Hpt domain-containing protein [Synergistales bacterium]|nr:Hpt domain-containing protein [Synergistales bacterium]
MELKAAMREHLAGEYELDAEAAEEIFEDACEGMRTALEGVEKAFAAQDGPALAGAAHTLKSNLRYLGCETLGQEAQQLEQQGKEGAFGAMDRSIADLRSKLGPVLDLS